MSFLKHLNSRLSYFAQTGKRMFSSSHCKNEKPILYSYCLSSCSWRVRIALGLKNISYDLKPTSLLKTDAVHSYTPEYRELNPMQQVPVLQIDGQTLCDSVAIMHYLEETRQHTSILPQNPQGRAKVREIVEIICSAIQPLQNRLVLAHLGKEKSIEWAQHWITRGFIGLETVLSSSSGRYCVGDEISMADCCLVPQVFNARRYHVNLDPYPTILRINANLESEQVVIDSHPRKQPDYPKK
ncbi:probable maleylacetoacetate isomerase 2 [Drosophila sulfurigaster albostrigata]|uniref:probable maleylacetoacetate isomerase 2 n=1 Tax=Drosophila sulfurigaster albostrigata TaxID=89887 RepID=UPI002D2190DC|nr:probable maleylacetoacetate isomerase 2 [Drosophila sulfurigaster albostrigata]